MLYIDEKNAISTLLPHPTFDMIYCEAVSNLGFNHSIATLSENLNLK